MSTKERLAQALEELGMPVLKRMIKLTRAGYYDDFESTLTFPVMTLVGDLRQYGVPEDFIDRVKNGEFDASSGEAEDWCNSLDGIESFNNLGLVAQVKEASRMMHKIKGTPFDEEKFDAWVKSKRVGEG